MLAADFGVKVSITVLSNRRKEYLATLSDDEPAVHVAKLRKQTFAPTEELRAEADADFRRQGLADPDKRVQRILDSMATIEDKLREEFHQIVARGGDISDPNDGGRVTLLWQQILRHYGDFLVRSKAAGLLGVNEGSAELDQFVTLLRGSEPVQADDSTEEN